MIPQLIEDGYELVTIHELASVHGIQLSDRHYVPEISITTDAIVRFIAAAGEHFLSFRRMFLYHNDDF